jgi:hypothetical protein
MSPSGGDASTTLEHWYDLALSFGGSLREVSISDVTPSRAKNTEGNAKMGLPPGESVAPRMTV